jgi:hypothetical protein
VTKVTYFLALFTAIAVGLALHTPALAQDDCIGGYTTCHECPPPSVINPPPLGPIPHNEFYDLYCDSVYQSAYWPDGPDGYPWCCRTQY